MKKTSILILFISLFLVNCNEDETDLHCRKDPNQTQPLNNLINDFTWKAMNSWYKWQENVPNLSDEKAKNKNYYAYLNKYYSSEKLFESLLYQKDKIDRFSWFIEDYEEQEKLFQGIYKSFGFRPVKKVLSNGKIVLLVTKVSLNSPASKKGLKRGDIIIGFNNQKFAEGDYKSIVQGYYDNSAEFIIGKKDGITEIKTIFLTKEEVSDHAVQLTKVFDVVGKKIGYFVYNGFRSFYNKELNEAFVKFKSEGITELILDLRYNGGGSVRTCSYLASLIYGEGQVGKDVFAKTIWNKKHQKENDYYGFSDIAYTFDEKGNYIKDGDIQLNRLTGINKLYVITSHNTASASEMIINGLRPYMEVITVGTTTYGKNVGSITLYDSPKQNYTSKKNANKTHKNAMQPITFQIYNKLNESDYTNGFKPNIEVDEFANLEDFLPFGNENETLLKAVLNKIKGITTLKVKSNHSNIIDHELLDHYPFENEMYIESEFLNN